MMDEEQTATLSDVTKDPALLSAAQEDIKTVDVLVCGRCHEAFHFIEEFQEHKAGKCVEISKLQNICEAEGKPQVWGFTLWKTKQHKSRKENEPKSSSWQMYQRWCNLEPKIKDTWIGAGQTIQFCSNISNAKINEFKLKKETDKDPLSIDAEDETDTNDVTKKNITKPVKLNSEVTVLPSTKNGDTNRAFRTLKENEKKEYVVEKIVAKRFNPRRKTFEYRIKWENFDSNSNTWEPAAHLNNCKSMVEEFEETLRKQKAEKAKANAPPKGRGRGRPLGSTNVSFLGDLTPGLVRPQRTSKQKALDQVKAWCGNISDTDETGVKRPFDDDDSDDSFEKKMKYEDYSDDSDVDMKSGLALKKIIKPTINLNNGVGKKLPQNVLIPDANGVVRINQKQLPSLSTGVYIMSKTAGIIKLDSSTSKVATSGGQTIVKVAPKIGQTQIKIVKKDGGTSSKIIQMTQKNISTPTKTIKPVITKVRRIEPDKSNEKSKISKPDESSHTHLTQDDSDDGLEELEFPKDLPLPPPDSPPREFVLDPFTGKIAGQEYPEKEVPVETNESDLTASSSLENIVKLAAADITEEDLKADPIIETQQLKDESTAATTNDVESCISTVTPVITTIESTTTVSNNQVLTITSRPTPTTSMNILHKSLTTSPRVKMPPRILNQSIATKSSTNVNPLIRRTTDTHSPLIRTRPKAPTPRFNISTPTKFHEHPARNVYSKSTNVERKIGNTTIYKNPHQVVQSVQRPQARIIQTNMYKSTPRKEILAAQTTHISPPQKKKTVISMPSLIGDDEPAATAAEIKLEESNTETVLEAASETTAVVSEASTSVEGSTTDLSSFTLADNENPVFITGDDGTVYQVAGQNEQGQTILITQGSDGQQQCLLVTSETASEETSPAEVEMQEVAPVEVTEPLNVKTDMDTSDQVVAQVVRAEPPSPGGTHKVVVLLPDGSLVVTQVSKEEFESLELD